MDDLIRMMLGGGEDPLQQLCDNCFRGLNADKGRCHMCRSDYETRRAVCADAIRRYLGVYEFFVKNRDFRHSQVMVDSIVELAARLKRIEEARVPDESRLA